MQHLASDDRYNYGKDKYGLLYICVQQPFFMKLPYRENKLPFYATMHNHANNKHILKEAENRVFSVSVFLQKS